MRTRWLSDHFEVPLRLVGPQFILRPLVIGDVVKDYDAVMTSQTHLSTVFGSDQSWPDGLTLEQDLIDLGWHQKEFQMGSSFAYTVLSPDEVRVLGCAYVFPPTKAGFDAEVYYWVRASHLELDAPLGATVRRWISEQWPFKQVAYPGRDIAWPDWDSRP